jgi:methylmalonyl-CoA/ethylmalonyl-CoA epimerase
MFTRSIPKFLSVTATPKRSFSMTTTGQDTVAQLKIGRLNHVAIAVPNLDKAMSLYRDILGGKVSTPMVSYTIFF